MPKTRVLAAFFWKTTVNSSYFDVHAGYKSYRCYWSKYKIHRSRSFRVTDFGIGRKLVCDLISCITTVCLKILWTFSIYFLSQSYTVTNRQWIYWLYLQLLVLHASWRQCSTAECGETLIIATHRAVILNKLSSGLVFIQCRKLFLVCNDDQISTYKLYYSWSILVEILYKEMSFNICLPIASRLLISYSVNAKFQFIHSDSTETWTKSLWTGWLGLGHESCGLQLGLRGVDYINCLWMYRGFLLYCVMYLYLILDDGGLVSRCLYMPLSAQSSRRFLKLFTDLAETTVLGRPFRIVTALNNIIRQWLTALTYNSL